MSDSPHETTSGFSATRRTIIATGGVALLAGVTGISLWRSSGQPTKTAAVTKTSPRTKSSVDAPVYTDATAISFNTHLNQEFVISGPSGEAKCKLVEITPESRIQGPDKAWTNFSIFFEAKPGFLPDGGTCVVAREGFEPAEIFLSPVSRLQDKTLLEAAFSLAI